MRDTANLGLVVGHRVPALAPAIAAAFALVAEIDIAIEFAHHQQVDAARDFGLERGQVFEPREAGRWPQVGEQAKLAAQTENRLFGAQFARQVVAGKIAHRAEQHRIGRARHFQRFGWQRMAVAAIGGGADIAFEQRQSGQRQRFQHAARLCDHFGPDAVAGENCDFQACFSSLVAPAQEPFCPSGRSTDSV